VFLDSYASAPGTRVALGLVNELVVSSAESPGQVAARLLAFDPTSVADHPVEHGPAFLALAQHLHAVIAALDEGRISDAAGGLNALLETAPAVPHLVEQDGQWSVHHHPQGAGLVQAWTSICAESLARIVGEGHAHRIHFCAAANCRRAFMDTTKNASRRYCSERCQNREKATTFRRRRATTR
jgi:predicted RNA-binding Zn ribbon-like protein